MTIGQRIREARKKAGISQEALAKVLGTTKQAIYKYENDIVTNIPMDKLTVISNTLSVTPSYLMGWDQDIYNHSIIEAVESYRKLHGFTKKQMEEHLDWKGMYDDLETGRILASADMSAIIENFLKPLDVSTSNRQTEKAPVIDEELSETAKELMAFVRSLPEEKQVLALKVLRTIAEVD